MEQRTFNSVEEECHFWKHQAKVHRQEKFDCQKEFEDFTDESRQLEQELETTIIQQEKQIRDLQGETSSLRDENESMRQRLVAIERDIGGYEDRNQQLISERDSMKLYIRDLEQKNDDLDRTNRIVSESVSGFEAMLNQAYEKNAMLEMEVDEKEQLQINLQRIMDEARDLKQELKIRNIAISPRNPLLATSSSATSSPSKNDLNDSRNNNRLVDKNTSTPSLPVTLLESAPLSNGDGPHNLTSYQKSLNDSTRSRPSQSVLKFDGNKSINPIAASTRVSALNIVADLLKKLDNLEAKLKSWKQKSPSTRLIEATANYNNNEITCSIENLDKIRKIPD